MREQLRTVVEKLGGHRVIVIGDVILDEYITGNTTRLSREAPIPVLEFVSRRHIAGGAANPAANITALGSTAVQIGLIGDDSAAHFLQQTLADAGIKTELIVCEERPTTVKMRLMAQMGLRFPQQVARLDTLSRDPIDESTQKRIIGLLQHQAQNADAFLFSDYHGGMLTPELVAQGRDIANQHAVFLAADAQGALDKYRGFDLVKCNAEEAQLYLQRTLTTHQDFADAAQHLCEKLDLRGGMVITRGAQGATLALCGQQAIHCPAPKVSDVYDTVGAGDTAIAVMTLAILANADYATAVILANYASGIVVQHVGNYTPTAPELLKAIDHYSGE
ncbi:MAG: ribokinase [Chloroflexi bacterium]|nr:MAG: ribokinase [Chloroflexota bacterium]